MSSQADRNQEPPRTNVILVVITNKANKTLGHDKYFKVFSPFGTIQRMLIFERSLTWKTFVEYDNPESAVRARLAMNDKYFCDDSTLVMNVYASKLQFITFQENNTGGVDYTVLRQKQKEAPKQAPQNIPFNYQLLQSQLQFQHQMQQQIQSLNTLMNQLQQVCADGFQTLQSQDLQNQIEKQQTILRDIADQQQNFQNLTDGYQNFLQGLTKSDEQQSTSTTSNQTQKQRKKLTLPTAEKNTKGEPIEFIQSFNETEPKENIYHSQTQDKFNEPIPNKMYQSEGKPLNYQQKLEDLNFDGLNFKDSADGSEEEDYQEEEDNDLFTYFKHDNQQKEMSEKDKQSILQKLNQDMSNQGDSSKLVSYMEKQTQINAQEKSSKSVDNIDQLITNSRLQQNQSSKSQSQSQTLSDKLEEYVNPLFMKTRKSKVIYARWFDKKVVTSLMLYNLFSTYGNIDKLIYLKERSSALVQYFTQDHAAIAKESLNDISFYGQTMKIFFSNYEEISLKTQPPKAGEIFPDVKSGEEYFQGCEETNRIKPDSTYTLAPPCDTIQVSNLSKLSCQSQVILQYFQSFGPIKQHKFVANGTNKHLCIIKYSSLEVAITVLANLNGIDIDGKRIQINFSKQKL